MMRLAEWLQYQDPAAGILIWCGLLLIACIWWAFSIKEREG